MKGKESVILLVGKRVRLLFIEGGGYGRRRRRPGCSRVHDGPGPEGGLSDCGLVFYHLDESGWSRRVFSRPGWLFTKVLHNSHCWQLQNWTPWSLSVRLTRNSPTRNWNSSNGAFRSIVVCSLSSFSIQQIMIYLLFVRNQKGIRHLYSHSGSKLLQ
jgi:hypothetical protein